MIERVARLLCSQPACGGCTCARPEDCWGWRHQENKARAVIMAMRDPTPDMTNHPSYEDGLWSRRNVEAFVDAALAG